MKEGLPRLTDGMIAIRSSRVISSGSPVWPLTSWPASGTPYRALFGGGEPRGTKVTANNDTREMVGGGGRRPVVAENSVGAPEKEFGSDRGSLGTKAGNFCYSSHLKNSLSIRPFGPGKGYATCRSSMGRLEDELCVRTNRQVMLPPPFPARITSQERGN
jgi:hypothetical protein